MKLEETLNGGFPGLYGEVVTEDCYRLRQLLFVPDVIFDVGANIGIFARYARDLFPNALIISLEPDPHNCAIFRQFTRDPRIILVQKALGFGEIFHGLTAQNGAGETYLSKDMLGYPGSLMTLDSALEPVDVGTVELWELIERYSLKGDNRILKLDCEGAENTIWDSGRSLAVFRQMRYMAAEMHFYALTEKEHSVMRLRTLEVLDSLSETHDWKLEGVHLWATRKEIL